MYYLNIFGGLTKPPASDIWWRMGFNDPYTFTNYCTVGDRRYNRAFLKTRKTIECTFGIWKGRWRSMDITGGSLCYNQTRYAN